MSIKHFDLARPPATPCGRRPQGCGKNQYCDKSQSIHNCQCNDGYGSLDGLNCLNPGI